MKKIIVSLMMIFVLTGCGSSSTPLEDLYGDMDAEETYDVMMEHMEEEVTYYKQEMTVISYYTEDDAKELGEAEYLLEDDGTYKMVNKQYNEDDEIESFTINDGETRYFLFYDEIDTQEYKYGTAEAVVADSDDMIQDLMEDVTILNAERNDKEDSIVLTFESEESYGSYSKYEIVINEEGFLASIEMISYGDASFDEKRFSIKYEVLDINGKSSIDTEKAITEIEAYAKELVP